MKGEPMRAARLGRCGCRGGAKEGRGRKEGREVGQLETTSRAMSSLLRPTSLKRQFDVYD